MICKLLHIIFSNFLSINYSFIFFHNLFLITAFKCIRTNLKSELKLNKERIKFDEY